MNLIAIGNFNNYYNRIHKPALSTYGDYITATGVAGNWHNFSKVNFNRNDGVETEQVINLGSASSVFADTYEPDYLLVCEGESEGVLVTGLTVVSRWFVLESHWNRERQLVLTLRRDLLADFWDGFKSEKFYCEKGPIPTGYGILKYNSEDQSFNQILKTGNRFLLKPESGQDHRYIIGYIDRSWKGGKVSTEIVDYYFEKWEDCPLKPYYDYPSSLIYPNTIEKFAICTVVKGISGTTQPTSGTVGRLSFVVSSEGGGPIGTNSDISGASGIGSPDFNLPFSGYTQSFFNAVSNKLQGDTGIENCEAYDRAIDDSRKIIIDPELISLYNNKVIAIGDKYYKVTFGTGNRKYISGIQLPGEACSCVANAIGSQITNLWTIPEFNKYVSGRIAYREATCAFSDVGTVTIGTRNHPGNLPYDIFVIQDTSGTRAFASNMATQFAGGNVVYDIQVLPFKPSSTTASSISIDGKTLYWADNDYATSTFYHDKIKTYSTDTEYKKGSNMDLCRIYSPDGAACWEFNPAKIGGVAKNSIKYEVTFAPHRPYIHIFPTFGGIYGSENKTLGSVYGESRGLICTGDYSIPYSTNNWATFQINNSAYQLAHDRMIQNMSVRHRAEENQEIVGGFAAAISGSLGGAQAGMSFGPYGAIAGGVTGMLMNAGAAGLQYYYNRGLRKEEMSYAEDMFGYQLQNIKAQAQPLAHSNYLTIGVSYFPYVELYEADSTEETIFVDRLEVNGWSLGIVTTLLAMKTAATASGAPTRYVKGTIVKFSGNEDAHVASEINNELKRGVRFLAS